MPDDGFSRSPFARGMRRPLRGGRRNERPEPRDAEAPAEGAVKSGGPWPIWSTVLPEHADARAATAAMRGARSDADPASATTLFRTWINGPCKTVYCCALEGTPVDGALTVGADGKETAKAVEIIAHDVMASSGEANPKQPGFRIHAITADAAAVRQDILDAVTAAPWSSGICFLYDPQTVKRSDVLAGLGLTFGSDAGQAAAAEATDPTPTADAG